MEFVRLLESVKETTKEPKTPVTVVTPESVETFFKDLSGYDEIAVDLETTSLDVMQAEIVGISIAAFDSVWYLPLAHEKGENLDSEKVLPRLKEIFEDSTVGKIGQNAKYDAIIRDIVRIMEEKVAVR